MDSHSEATTLRSILGALPFFHELTPQELDRIIAIGRLVTYPKDAKLFKEGDPGEALYVVVDGSVRVSRLIPGAKEDTVAFIEQGGAFGEMSLFDEFPRSATISAHEDCRVLFIDKQAFLDFVRDDSVLARKILWAFCRTLSIRLRQTNDRIVALFGVPRLY
jgi:CRP-like cAMP-binding protein